MTFPTMRVLKGVLCTVVLASSLQGEETTPDETPDDALGGETARTPVGDPVAASSSKLCCHLGLGLWDSIVSYSSGKLVSPSCTSLGSQTFYWFD